jgi:hypothetical protein
MTTFYNRTRRSRSIPVRLLREGRLHLLPVYYLGRLSKLGREAIENSGSYEFADHVYGGRAEGSYLVGRLLDALFLNLPAARSFRGRYLFARATLMRVVDARLAADEPVRALAIPCGLARELFDVCAEVEARWSDRRALVRLDGVDLDPVLVERLRRRSATRSVTMRFTCADAFSLEAFGDAPYDAIVSLGFTEFLDDAKVVAFYRRVREGLVKGGTFITTGLLRDRLADHLLRTVAELDVNYRGPGELAALAAAAGFTDVRTSHDERGLLATLIAVRT